MKHKITILLTSIIIVLFSFNLSISAVDLKSNNNLTTVSYEETVTDVGKTVCIPLTIKNNPGIASFCFRIEYDNEVLEPLSAKRGDVLTEGLLIDNISNHTKKDLTILWFSSSGDISEDGTIALLTFQVLQTNKFHTELRINCLPEDILNYDKEYISCIFECSPIIIDSNSRPTQSAPLENDPTETSTTTIIATPTASTTNVPESIKPTTSDVIIIEPTETSTNTNDTSVPLTSTSENTHPTEPGTNPSNPDDFNSLLGDVNNDQKVNIKDATLIQKHLAQLTIIDVQFLNLADTTKDGTVSIKDATKIQKYVAQLIPSLD